MIGQTLCHYKILRRAGSGGMGAVYVAEDSRLRREVALKLLPPELAGDPDRRVRFEREARVVASLNHPHIVTIYSVEESDGVHFLTMELIEGGTLAEMIPENGFSLRKFFELSIPLVDAVSAAHRRGITHRDLKPDNIMMSAEGRLKVCDFGVAKLAETVPESASITSAPTIAQTEEGSILGTVAYMSPEQAEGKKIDERSDIFSLGIVLYEFATGRLPFTGDSKAGVVSSLLRDTPPPVCELNPKLPRQLGRIIHRCLAKDPIRRFQTSIDLRNELEELKAEVESGLARPLGGGDAAAGTRSRWRIGRVAAWLAVPVAIAAAAVGAALLIDGRAIPEPGSRDGIVMGRFDQLTDAAGEELFPALSPDGKTLAYTSREGGNWDIYLLRVGGINPMNLTADSPARDTQPVFSPDGEWIAFRSDRDEPGLYMMGATGESVRRLTRGGYYPSWSPGGDRIVYSTLDFTSPLARGVTSALRIVDVATGDVTDIPTGDAIQPHWSPSGHRIAYWGLVEGTGQRDIWTIAPDGSDPRPVTQDTDVDWNPVWSHDGRHLYFVSDRGGTMNLWRVAIDEKTGERRGEPRPVTTEVSAWSGYPSISRDGTRIAYVSEAQTANVQGLALDPAHRVLGQPAWVTRGAGQVKSCDPSPDGEWMACARGGRQEDVFLVRPDGSDRRMVTNDPHRDRYPRWSPDGQRLAFFSDRNGSWEIWSVNLDGSGLRQLTDTPGRSASHPVWSPDGTRMLAQFTDERSVVIFDPRRAWAGQTPEPIPAVAAMNGWFAAWSWSPDGRRLAGTIYEMRGADRGMGTYSLETREFEPLGAGGLPVWLSDSRTLVYADAGTLNMTNADTRETRRLLDITPDIIDPLSVRVAPRRGAGEGETTTIYFSRSTPEANIWLLNLQ